MRRIGCPRPVLQAPHADADGHIGDTDFHWPEFNAVGEADGKSKYLDPDLRGGRSVAQVHLDEKVREDRIRALPRAFARWDWNVGANPTVLRARLERIGLPMGLRRW